MRLPASAVALFYKLYHAVLLYTNHQLGLTRHVTTLAQLRAMPEEAQYELREAFYAHRQLLEAFVQENPQRFTAEELALVASWHHGVHGQFYVLRHLQRYTVFLDVQDPPKAYGVLALHDDFPVMFPRVPRLIDTMLLPFHNQITYDGQCRYYNVVFGGGMTRRLHDTCQRAQAQYGIITSLPLEAQAVAPSEEEQLRLYLRNARNREMYEEEIVALVQKNRSLETLYHQEMGRVHARTYSPQLRAMGLNGVWFAILEGVPIASGTTHQEVQQAVKRIVPQHKLPFIYTFQVKGAAHRRGAKPSESP
jgi:hypothetical protein